MFIIAVIMWLLGLVFAVPYAVYNLFISLGWMASR